MKRRSDEILTRITAVSYTIPTEAEESDGTLIWNSTTMVIVHAEGGGKTGLGYSYCHKSVARLINDKLAPLVQGLSAMNLPLIWQTMVHGCRNLGDASLVMMAVAAVDNSLWDLKAKIFDLPLVTLLGGARQSVPIYGSGGFTSYDVTKLTEQLSGWRDAGIRRMKIKIGRQPAKDPLRVQAARQAIGDDAELMVDANGAFTVKEAMAMAERLVEYKVSWFEEPVPHRNLQGLHLLRRRCPAGMQITAGEYGFNLDYFTRMITADAVDVIQADATRCSMSGFIQVAHLCQAHYLPFSAHTAPALHAHVCCSLLPVHHIEYFYDHVRIEQMFFDDLPQPHQGELRPNLDLPGMGLILKERDIKQFAD